MKHAEIQPTRAERQHKMNPFFQRTGQKMEGRLRMVISVNVVKLELEKAQVQKDKMIPK